jgi:small-conductance mechanosensitive channel
MGILLFMALFALINTVTLGNALMALFENLANRLFSKDARPIRHALAEAVATPLAWLVSLFCTVPWLWSVPGARYLLQNAMETHYELGDASFNFSKLLLVGLLFFLFRSFIKLSNTSLSQLPEHMPNIEHGVIPPLRTMSGYILWALFALISLGILGVNFTSLAVVAGGLSVGIGFGMQNLFNNLVSGLILIFGRTILVGDSVDVAGTSGTVMAINIRSTTIETPEKALVYVPNSAIMAGQFTNWTRNSRMVRRSIVVGVAYDSNVERVTQILLETALRQKHVLKKPEPAALFTSFGANSLDFTLNVFIDDINNGLSTLSAIRFDIEQAFREEGIEIPFPQLTLHMPNPANLETLAAAVKK